MIADLRPYPTMKDSGVEWLGEVPGHWEVRRARYLFTEVDQRSKAGEETHLSMSQRLGLVPSEGVQSSLTSESYAGGKLCEPEDLVLNRLKAHLGVFALANQSGVISPDYSVFRRKCPSSMRYFEQTLRSPACRGELRTRAKGIVEGFWRLYTDDFYDIRLPVPPLPEQAAIVRYLDYVERRVRRLVRAKRRLIALLKEQKQAIIHRAVTRGLDPDVPLRDSGVEWLGPVPAHWEVVSLDLAASSIQTGPFGSQLHADEYVTGGIPVINPSHMSGGRIGADRAVTVSREKAEELARHTLLSGDIVAARRGELGRCALVTDSEAGWLCGTGSIRIRPRSDLLESAYLVRLLSSRGIKDTLSLSSIGATMDNLNAAMVSRLRIPLPPIEEQCEIMESIAHWSDIIGTTLDSAKREIELLSEYRTRLVADVVTGKLDVREAVAALPEVHPLAADGQPADVLDAEADPDEPEAMLAEAEA